MNIPAKYTLVINGRPEGPFSVDELRERKLKPGDFVRTPDMDDYKEAHELPELRLLFGFKTQYAHPQYFAGFDQRLLAAALDWVVVSAGFIFAALVLVFLIHNRTARIAIAISLAAIVPMAYFIYHVVAESSAKQGTWGKQILKIRVTDMQGQRISMAAATGRNLAKILCLLTFFLGYLISFFNKKQQCLHDMVANTLVIKDRLL